MKPAVSIISVCFRNPDELERTLGGFTDLDPSLFEVIIVDGSPDDSCAQVARRFPAFRHLHGPDTGKYDAMNKGVLAASGDALLFMNSGDELADPPGFEAMVRSQRDKLATTLIYGDCVRFVNRESIEYPAPELTEKNWRLGIFPSHQSILIPTRYHREHLYDPDMFFASDGKMLKQAFRDLPRLHVPIVVGSFQYGGACTSPGSWKLLRKQYRELCEVQELRFAERVATAISLGRRKLLHMLVGEAGLQKLQAQKLRRAVMQ